MYIILMGLGMIKPWMFFFFAPIFTFAAYPIYDDDVASLQPEQLAWESPSTKDAVKKEQSEKSPTRHDDKKTQKESKKKQKDRLLLRDQRTIKPMEELSSFAEDKKQSAISKNDPVKRNSVIQSSPSRSKLRRNPNRPRVIQREEPKKPQNLSKIEADAEEMENGLSTQPNKEKGNPDELDKKN